MRKILKFSPILVFVVILFVGWTHRFWLFDTYRLLSYEPTSEITSLADESGMSDKGRRLFFAGKPELLLEQEFDQECEFAELGLVLGCYRSADIFILDVTEEQLEPVEAVTAAHEMLHVVYSRLSTGEEAEMEALLDRQLEIVENQRIIDEIDGYRQDPQADLYNEMHSIFGTELADLLPELEQHYTEFFADRSLVLAESSEYEKVFTELEQQIAEFDSQLDSLNIQIDQLEAEIISLNGQIKAERSRLDQLLASDQISQYNASVPGFNNLVNTHNFKVEQVQELVAQFNGIVAERNENVAAKNNLIKSLDSNVEAIE